jgi:molybdopterin/thiamine biosynthesis adenylyltransferase/rhodanese-related sulfurtransferase
MLTDDERNRYSRHILLPQIGEEGQEKLKRASALIVGVGGLGSPAAMYLTAAGIGRLGLVDFDTVDESNLQRQILYGESVIGERKLDAAWKRLRDLNHNLRIETFNDRLSARNALPLMEPYDLVLDGTDNFATRYLVNDACVMQRKPNVYASIYRFEGQVSVFDATRGPCYRCLYPDPPPPNLVPSCAEGGVLGVLPGIIGSLQAAEAIKLITGAGEPLIGRMLLFDALTATFRSLRVPKNPDCKLCGPDPEIRELIEYEEYCEPANNMEITARELFDRLQRGESPLLLDVREPHEWSMGHLNNAKHIPMQQIPLQVDALPRDAEIIVYCRSGARSANVQQYMLQNGFKKVKNLAGGLIAWSREVDPSMPVR